MKSRNRFLMSVALMSLILSGCSFFGDKENSVTPSNESHGTSLTSLDSSGGTSEGASSAYVSSSISHSSSISASSSASASSSVSHSSSIPASSNAPVSSISSSEISSSSVSSSSSESSSSEIPHSSEEPSSSSVAHEHTFATEWSYDDYQHWHASTCGHDVTTPKEEHHFEAVVTDPTYDDGGYTTYTCRECGKTVISDHTPKKEHNYSTEWSYDSTKHWHACVDADWSNLKKDEDFHDFGSWSVTREPTSEANGEKSRTCQVCGYTETAPITNDQTPEDFTFILNDDKRSYSALFSENLVQAFNNNIEIEELTYPDSWNGFPVTHVLPGWVLSSNSEYSIPYMKSAFDSLKTITIPNTVDTIEVGFLSGLTNIVLEPGNPNFTIVDDILYTADEKEIVFCSRNKTGNLNIQDGVETIGRLAFAYCDLSSVHMPTTLKAIEGYSFYRCDNLQSVNIPSSVEFIEYFPFLYCWSLNQVDYDLPLSLRSFGDYTSVSGLFNAFYAGVSGGPGQTYPFDFETYLNYDLPAQERLQPVIEHSRRITLNLGQNATGNSYDAVQFIMSNFLEVEEICGIAEVNVDPNNQSYSSQNGVLYSKDGSNLIYFPSIRTGEFAVPDTTTAISEWAFRYSLLTSVLIPDSVTTIGPYALSFCLNLAIYCESSEPKSGWASSWNGNSRVYWGTDHIHHFSEWNVIDANHCLEEQECSICDYIDHRNNHGDWYYTFGNGVVSVTDQSTLIKVCGKCGETQEVGSIRTNRSSIEKLIIPESVASIGSGAFDGCSSLETFVVDEDNEYYSSIDGVLYSKDGTRLIRCPEGKRTITIPDGVPIDYSSFRGCSSLTSVILPEGFVFGRNEPSIEYIDPEDDVFADCTSLTSFVVDEDNEYYSSIDGVLYSKDGTRLIRCPEGKRTITIPDGVTSIADYAFYYCSSLSSVVIPDSVTSIGNYAFYYCSSLSSVVIPDSVASIGNYAFSWGESLESVIIGSGVASIPDYAFADCRVLESVIIGSGVASIGSHAFDGCSSLSSVVMPDSVASIGDDAFAWCGELRSVTIGSGVASIGSRAFYYCFSLSSIAIPDSVASIGSGAFDVCSSLGSFVVDEDNEYYSSIDGVLYSKDGTRLIRCPEGKRTITIPDGVTSIADYAFYGCDSLSSIAIPDSVTSIGDHAFDGCSSLSSIVIPGSVASIGSRAFYRCSSLESVTIGSGVATIANYAFADCRALESVTIGSVASIGDYAFAWCEGLESVTIGSAASIGADAFWGCSSLSSIVIPDGVTSIGSGAFENCSSLSSVVIPDSVTSIGDYAFEGCSSLESLIIGNRISRIDNNVFYGCDNLAFVFYTGTYDYEWVGPSSFGGKLIYFYSETEPTQEGNYWHYDANGLPVVWCATA